MKVEQQEMGDRRVRSFWTAENDESLIAYTRDKNINMVFWEEAEAAGICGGRSADSLRYFSNKKFTVNRFFSKTFFCDGRLRYSKLTKKVDEDTSSEGMCLNIFFRLKQIKIFSFCVSFVLFEKC